MRISATRLEQFRRMRSGLMTKEAFINQLSDVFVPSFVMELGTALHEVLELPSAYENNGSYLNNQFRFSADTVLSMLENVPKNALQEMKHTVTNDGITLVGKVDAIYDKTAYDYKVSDKEPSVNKLMSYQDSMQWKVYHTVFEVDTVDFIFCGVGLSGGVYTLLDKPRVLRCKPDIYTSEEVWIMADKLRTFVIDNGLEVYFQDKSEEHFIWS